MWHACCLTKIVVDLIIWQQEVIMRQRESMIKDLNLTNNYHKNGITKSSRERALKGFFKTFETGGRSMRSIKYLTIIIAIGFLATSCVSDGQNTGRGAVLGGILGAVAGQAIGHNTAGTLIGAGAGALSGAIIGNTHDQQVMQGKMEDRYSGYPERPYDRYYGPESSYSPNRPYATDRPHAALPPQESYRGSPQALEPPPGHWVDVPGQWVNGKWVPSHKVWVPVNPGSPYRR